MIIEMEDLKRSDQNDLNLGKQGIIVINTSDQAVRITAWINQVPDKILGFYYTFDSKIKIKLFDLVSGNAYFGITDRKDTIELPDLLKIETIISAKIFPLIRGGDNFRKLIYWLDTGLEEHPELFNSRLTDTVWRIDSFEKLDLTNPGDKLTPEIVLRSIYNDRYRLFATPFEMPVNVKEVDRRVTAKRVRDTIINFAEVAYTTECGNGVTGYLDDILKRDHKTDQCENLLTMVNSWLNKGIFLHDRFKLEYSKIFGEDVVSDVPKPKIITFCDEHSAILPDILVEIKEMICTITGDQQPPTINYRNLIKIYNQLSHLLSGETLAIEGSGTSWPALIVDSPSSDLVTMTSRLKTHNKLVFSMCNPKIFDLSKQEAVEVLLFLEGLDSTAQTRFLNIKNALVEYLKAL